MGLEDVDRDIAEYLIELGQAFQSKPQDLKLIMNGVIWEKGVCFRHIIIRQEFPQHNIIDDDEFDEDGEEE